jgi:predicted acetyltransferase
MNKHGGNNMEEVSLIKPCKELEEQYLSFYQEWKDSGENMVPWVISKDPTNFEEMIQFLLDNENEGNLPDNWVPDSTYWLVTKDNRIVGAVNIRHSLTEKLFNCGGHIGYGIRPSERRKGLATKLLALALEKAEELGIQKVLVVCDEDNIASEKTILSNGGKPDSDYIEEDGNVIKRFWIQL